MLDELPGWCSLAFERPDCGDDIKLDSLSFELVNDGGRNQFPMLPLGEVCYFLVHGFPELVPVGLLSGLTQVHGVWITSCCS